MYLWFSLFGAASDEDKNDDSEEDDDIDNDKYSFPFFFSSVRFMPDLFVFVLPLFVTKLMITYNDTRMLKKTQPC